MPVFIRLNLCGIGIGTGKLMQFDSSLSQNCIISIVQIRIRYYHISIHLRIGIRFQYNLQLLKTTLGIERCGILNESIPGECNIILSLRQVLKFKKSVLVGITACFFLSIYLYMNTLQGFVIGIVQIQISQQHMPGEAHQLILQIFQIILNCGIIVSCFKTFLQNLKCLIIFFQTDISLCQTYIRLRQTGVNLYCLFECCNGSFIFHFIQIIVTKG